MMCIVAAYTKGSGKLRKQLSPVNYHNCLNEIRLKYHILLRLCTLIGHGALPNN